MSGLTRRQILRGLAAGTGLAALGRLARPAAGAEAQLGTQTGGAPFQRVNILLHGRFVVDFGGEEVSVYPAAATPAYAFLAGTWQQEKSLVPDVEYRFSGVMTGPRPELRNIDPRRVAVFNRKPVDTAASFCRLVFPFPDFIAPLRTIRREHGKPFFTGAPEPILKPETMPEVLALSYARPDLTSRLECRPLDWTPVILGGNVNLHVWAAPARKDTAQDSAKAFEQMTKLLDAPGLGLNEVYASIKPPRPDENPETPGVSCAEELTLVERLNDGPSCGTKNSYHPEDARLSDLLSVVLY